MGSTRNHAEPRDPAALAADPIAIIGIGCRFPHASSPLAFWRLLRAGGDAIREVPPERWDVDALWNKDPKHPGTASSRWGGFLDAVDGFDAAFFGIPLPEARAIDPQHRLLLEVGWEAVEDAGIPTDRLAGTATAVFVGLTTRDYFALAPERTFYAGHEALGNTFAIAANRLSYALDLRGPSVAVDTSCSASLVAVHLACQSLRAGEAELALAGGVNLMLVPEGSVCQTKAGVTSPSGRCRAFDAGADGLVRGEGAGVVVLKPLGRALADGDRIYAVVRGSAVAHNGRTNGLSAPSSLSQQALLRAAYHAAGVVPADVDYVECHGTGTLLGDALEARALGAVVGSGRLEDRRCRIGSVKTNIGHLEAAAGIAALVKVALALHHGELPPSLHFESANSYLSFAELGLQLQVEPTPWPGYAAPAIAGISALGFGGANAHVVLEGTPPPSRDTTEGCERPQLLLVSGRTAGALRDNVARYRSWLADEETRHGTALADLCDTTRTRRTHHRYRLALLGSSHSELAGALSDALSAPMHRAAGRARVALLCPGEGALSDGAWASLLEQQPIFRATVLAALDVAIAHGFAAGVLGVLCGGECAEPRVRRLALFLLQLGLAAVWSAWGVEPHALIGQGAGSVAAAHLAGALSLDDAIERIASGDVGADLTAPPAALPLAVAADSSDEATTTTAKLLSTSRCTTLIELAAVPALGRSLAARLIAAKEAVPSVHAAVRGVGEGTTAFLTTAASLWRDGVGLDFDRIYGRVGRCVSLPSYAWQREGCWWWPPRSRTDVRPPHLLLARYVPLALSRHTHCWESLLTAELVRYAAGGEPTAACFAEVACAAARAIYAGVDPIVLRVRLTTPLAVAHDEARRLQVLLRARRGGGGSVRFLSQGLGEGATWTLHAVVNVSLQRQPRERDCGAEALSDPHEAKLTAV